jgi:hypothetical protein
MPSDPKGHRRRGPRWDRGKPIVVPRPDPIIVQGIQRLPRERLAPTLPPTERHLKVLEAIEPGEIVGAAELGRRLGFNVVSTLYALTDRELVVHIRGKGWRRA